MAEPGGDTAVAVACLRTAEPIRACICSPNGQRVRARGVVHPRLRARNARSVARARRRLLVLGRSSERSFRAVGAPCSNRAWPALSRVRPRTGSWPPPIRRTELDSMHERPISTRPGSHLRMCAMRTRTCAPANHARRVRSHPGSGGRSHASGEILWVFGRACSRERGMPVRAWANSIAAVQVESGRPLGLLATFFLFQRSARQGRG
jgi:hypothetical protein